MALILSGDTGVPASGMPTGSVIQTVTTTSTSYVQSSTSTYADSGLAVNITPISATSKILVIAYCGQCGKTANDTQMNFQITRAGSSIYTASALNTGSAVLFVSNVTLTYLDSPSTTSTIQYKIQFANRDTGTAQFNLNGTAILTLQEIHG